MRRSIREPLALHASENSIRALLIVNAKCDAIAIAKIKLGAVAVQMPPPPLAYRRHVWVVPNATAARDAFCVAYGCIETPGEAV